MFGILIVQLFEILYLWEIYPFRHFIVLSVVNYQDGQQISMYLSIILDMLILIAPPIMHLKMVSAAFIRDMQQTPFKMHHCMYILHVHVLTILTYASCRCSLIISAIRKNRCYLL